MTQPSGQNPYPGYGQQPYQQGYGGYGQMPPGQYPPTAPQYPGQQGPGYGQGAPNTAPVPRTGGAGSSRILPIITGVGLAIGVFSGLLIVRGLGSESEASEKQAPVASAAIDAGVAVAEKPVAEAPPPDAAPPKPITRPVVLTFDVKPRNAVITVGGAAVSGTDHQVEVPEGGSQTLVIVASAEGYVEQTLSHEVAQKDAKTSAVKIRLEKAPRETAASGEDKPDTVKPDTAKPDTVKPSTTKPTTVKPDPKKNNKGKDSGTLIDL